MATAVRTQEQIDAELEERLGFRPGEVLFVGLGKSAVCWYRAALPAMFLGADWVGLIGEPPKVALLTGLVKRETRMPAFDSYRVVVIQQPKGPGWLKVIRRLQSRGIKVIFEVDDYLHAIRKQADHDFRHDYSKRDLQALELNMRVCDGIICSTEFIARRYRAYNPRVWVCENGVDVGRYALTRPPRPTVNIGWAGATGHAQAILPWLRQVADVMAQCPNTAFVSIGMNYADSLRAHFGPRAISIPFTLLDTYPSAMTNLDIAIAPAGKSNFYRGKSDLRWVEAGALGIPIIADPDVYPKIEHGVTGFHAATPDEAGHQLRELVDDESLRLQVGDNVRRYVHQERDMRVAVNQWVSVIRDALVT